MPRPVNAQILDGKVVLFPVLFLRTLNAFPVTLTKVRVQGHTWEPFPHDLDPDLSGRIRE
jgi:hypothetical protein